MSAAWGCSGSTNDELIDNLRAGSLIETDAVEAAMRAIDRANFCTTGSPYEDSPQYLGYNITISAPHMHAMCLEVLREQLKPGCRALDVGSGSGYLTAAMGVMVGSEGKVVGIDHLQELVSLGIGNMEEDAAGSKLLQDGTVEILLGNGWEGYSEHAPYDAIHVGAAAKKIPKALVEQLAVGGRMVIPVGPAGGAQALMLVEKTADDAWDETVLSGVRYVPLTETPEEQWKA